jgi:hypothetical protein
LLPAEVVRLRRAPIFAHSAIPETANVDPCEHGG